MTQKTIWFEAAAKSEQVTDDDLKYLADHHPKVRQLTFSPLNDNQQKWKSTELLTDEGLWHLGRPRKLESVNSLVGSNITDKGLRYLSGLKNLRRLDLRNTRIAGVGFSHLRHLEELYRLELPASLTTEGAETMAAAIMIRQMNFIRSEDSNE